MQLRPPRLTSSASAGTSQLQQEVADSVTRRHEDVSRRKWQGRLFAILQSIVYTGFLLVITVGGFYAWQCGLFDDLMDGRLYECSSAVGERVEGAGMREDLRGGDMADAKQGAEAKRVDIKERKSDAYAEVVKLFRTANIDYWKNARDEDKPIKGKGPLAFWCIAAGENEEPVFLELSIQVGAKMKVRRLSANVGMVDATEAEFAKLTDSNPYLVMREGRAYFATKKSRMPMSCPAPAQGESLNPSELEFGALYAIFPKMQMQAPPFVYDVFFEVKGDSTLKIASVRFGEKVYREAFVKKIESQYGLDSTDAMAVDAVLKVGRVKISSRIDGP